MRDSNSLVTTHDSMNWYTLISFGICGLELGCYRVLPLIDYGENAIRKAMNKRKKPATCAGQSVLGNVLLSQDPAVQVPSALKGLTVVFEMGTRGSPSPSSPNV